MNKWVNLVWVKFLYSVSLILKVPITISHIVEELMSHILAQFNLSQDVHK